MKALKVAACVALSLLVLACQTGRSGYPLGPADEAGAIKTKAQMFQRYGVPTVAGPEGDGPSRVGTVSFLHRRKSSREVTKVVDRSGIAIRNGHMYAYHLCEALGLDPEDGGVRVSLVHYNTPEEI